jgi:dethiobiotin synthetase/adenosylmethionine--8-amino-7-oxononanoate aminotransferase
MFPENAHAPALELAEALLALDGCEAASRVFLSDNGSTAVEVALKMALRMSAVRRPVPAGAPPRRVLALAGSYHGDTLGAALAQAPSVFTASRQAPWYTPKRGLFLQAPTCRRATGGGWEVMLQPGIVAPAHELCFADEAALFDGASRDGSRLASLYRRAVEMALVEQADDEQPGGVGAVGVCILEPALQGAGGMQLVDPAFQRALVAVAQARGLPVIFDEVFSGLWRLGAPTGAALLGLRPELLCMGKLLTGGTLPLAATLASDEAFDAFRGTTALDALLHGHSFAGSAAGCAAAVQALSALGRRNANMGAGSRLHALWRDELVLAITRAPNVRRVVHVGTVFAVELQSKEPGYRSGAARMLVRRLRIRHGALALEPPTRARGSASPAALHMQAYMRALSEMSSTSWSRPWSVQACATVSSRRYMQS